jgi:biopolymer transport protein ExbD
MAELDTSGGGKNKGGKVRSKKQSTRVDLTAMVDLAFLLITFFMLTTTLAKPQAMDLAMPDKEKQDQQELTIADNRTMTILLGAK